MDLRTFIDALPIKDVGSPIGTVTAALIGFGSALIVAYRNQKFMRKEFSRQQEILLRVESAKTHVGERQKELQVVGKLASDVGVAVKNLTSRVCSSDGDMVNMTAEAFQSTGPFLKYVGKFEGKWLLEPHEVEQLRQLEKALTAYFLSLDFDGDRRPGSSYIVKLKDACDELQLQVNSAEAIFKASYLPRIQPHT